jgi:hypothetical protein
LSKSACYSIFVSYLLLWPVLYTATLTVEKILTAEKLRVLKSEQSQRERQALAVEQQGEQQRFIEMEQLRRECQELAAEKTRAERDRLAAEQHRSEHDRLFARAVDAEKRAVAAEAKLELKRDHISFDHLHILGVVPMVYVRTLGVRDWTDFSLFLYACCCCDDVSSQPRPRTLPAPRTVQSLR